VNNANRGSRLSSYVGGSQTALYRQVDIGKGTRSDFTHLNIKDKSESKYEFEKFGSIGYQVHLNKERGTRKHDTFGNVGDKYEPAVVNTGFNHYLGRGVKNYNGVGIQEYDLAQAQTKTSSARLPYLSTDRGMFSPSTKQMKLSLVGPGAYSDKTKEAMIDKSFRKVGGTFGSAPRDVSFSKYSSVHSTLVTKGLN